MQLASHAKTSEEFRKDILDLLKNIEQGYEADTFRELPKTRIKLYEAQRDAIKNAREIIENVILLEGGK